MASAAAAAALESAGISARCVAAAAAAAAPAESRAAAARALRWSRRHESVSTCSQRKHYSERSTQAATPRDILCRQKCVPAEEQHRVAFRRSGARRRLLPPWRRRAALEGFNSLPEVSLMRRRNAR